MRTYDELSLAEKVAKIPQGKRDQIFAGYTQDDYASIDFDWNFWGRPEQLTPPGNWGNWLILAGRGFGKTRTGAEWVRANMRGDTPLTGGRWRHVALIRGRRSGRHGRRRQDGIGPDRGLRASCSCTRRISAAV